ncbi:MAG: CrcB family protein, partial [Prevotella sp.]|nr:CrcB family protein [Prevotella sp.]
MLGNILLVAAGGAVGSVCRYLLSSVHVASFPWGTLTVNVLGSLLIGLLAGLSGRGILSPELKLLLVTGFCGGFTTFSTFA